MESRSDQLAGKIALVTGSSRGIGWATAELFAAAGATVVLNARSDAAALDARAADLRERYGATVTTIVADVSKPQMVAEMYRTIFRTHKRLDVLVNNAGILEDALIGMIQNEMIDRVLDTNTKGTLYNLQAAARLMVRQRSGSIVNVSSIIGVEGNDGQLVYSASKAAIIGLTYSAAKELAPQGIRVNAIAPGYIDTDMIRALPPEKHALRLSQIPTGRAGRPEEVARAILFLASDASSYVNGQVLGVDGAMRI